MKTILIIVAVTVVFGGLLWWAGNAQKPALVLVPGTNVACLPNGHQNISVHIHPELTITVNGEEENVPGNIGVSNTCMAELHTHEAGGTIHVETATPGRLSELTFADFFAVWGMPLEREGYSLGMTLNGKAVDSLNQIPLEDHAQIVLVYSSK